MDFFAIICRYIGWKSYCHSTFADLSSRYSPSAQAHRSHVLRWIRYTCFHGLWFYETGSNSHSCLADSAGIGRYSALGRTRHLGRSFRILSSTISPFSLIMISVSSPAGMLDCDIGILSPFSVSSSSSVSAFGFRPGLRGVNSKSILFLRSGPGRCVARSSSVIFSPTLCVEYTRRGFKPSWNHC